MNGPKPKSALKSTKVHPHIQPCLTTNKLNKKNTSEYNLSSQCYQSINSICSTLVQQKELIGNEDCCDFNIINIMTFLSFWSSIMHECATSVFTSYKFVLKYVKDYHWKTYAICAAYSNAFQLLGVIYSHLSSFLARYRTSKCLISI